MHHHRIATLFHPLQLLAHPPLAHAHLLGRLALTQHPVPGPFQPFQLVPFLLAHLDSFHPSALRLSRGTFYLAQLGTFHLAATFMLSMIARDLLPWYDMGADERRTRPSARSRAAVEIPLRDWDVNTERGMEDFRG